MSLLFCNASSRGGLFARRDFERRALLSPGLDAVRRRVAQHHGQRCLRIIEIAAERREPLAGARHVHCHALIFDRQLAPFFHLHAGRAAHPLQAFHFQLERLLVPVQLLRVQKERRGLIRHLIALRLRVDLRAPRRLPHASQLIGFRPIEQRHIGTGLDDGRRRAFDAGGITPNLRQSAAGVELGDERVFGDSNGRLRLLLVQPRQYQVGILFERDFHGLSQRQRMHLRKGRTRANTKKQGMFQHSSRVAEPGILRLYATFEASGSQTCGGI